MSSRWPLRSASGDQAARQAEAVRLCVAQSRTRRATILRHGVERELDRLESLLSELPESSALPHRRQLEREAIALRHRVDLHAELERFENRALARLDQMDAARMSGDPGSLVQELVAVDELLAQYRVLESVILPEFPPGT